jgi:hypothetical protein
MPTRGADERGQRFVLLLDGLNERSATEWADLVVALVPEMRKLGGRLVVTCREGFWERDVLPRLRGLVTVAPVVVGDFTEDELRAVLRCAGVKPKDVPDRVRQFMRTPRVCAVALSILGRLAAQPFELTVERLLLEYWRHRLEERGDLLAHNASDFDRLLRSHARAYLAGPPGKFDRDKWRQHSGPARRGDRRSFHDDLTEIEEGRFLQIVPEQPDFYQFNRDALPFALGLLITREIADDLRGGKPDPLEVVDAVLDEVGGFDLVGEALAAGAGIACLDDGYPPSGRAALVAAWLLAFASARQPTLTEASRGAIARALRHPNEVVANVAADVVYVARDEQLDAEIIAAARRGDLTLDGSDAGFWRSRAVAAAVVTLRRAEDLDLVAPRFLSFVSRRLNGVGYGRLADDLEAAVERLLEPVEVAEPTMGQLIRQTDGEDSAPITRVKDKTTGGGGEAEAVPDAPMAEGDRERIAAFRARQRILVKEARDFLDALAAENADWALRTPDRQGLAKLIDLDAARVGAWVDRILAEPDRFRLRSVRNLGVGLASAYSRIDPEKAGKLFDHLSNSPYAARLVFGKASILQAPQSGSLEHVRHPHARPRSH